MQLVEQKRQVGKKILVEQDSGGGVFVPVPGKGQRPAWSMGPDGGTKEPLFQCPQSAIPGYVWELLALWWSCRAMKTLPRAGAFADQPLVVRQSFPVFEMLAQSQEQHSGQRGTAVTVAQTMAAMFGGR